MNEILALQQINPFTLFVWVVIVLVAIKFIWSLIEWFCTKVGLETKWMRQKREDHEKIEKTSKELCELKNTHSVDTDKIIEFMEKIEKQMKTYSDNRVNDRQVSIERETRLNDRINGLQDSVDARDKQIDKIASNLDKLTVMFIDKQISDYRWEIINFATAISEKKPCTKDGYKHCFATYEKYEKILEENNMENGEVEISMEIVRDGYKEKLKEGF